MMKGWHFDRYLYWWYKLDRCDKLHGPVWEQSYLVDYLRLLAVSN